MSKPLQFRNSADINIYPDELLRRYRNRAGLSQVELAHLIGLNSSRVLQSWEGGFTFPRPARLQNLIEIFYKKNAFTGEHELDEASELWLSVKHFYEARSEKLLSYPHFDHTWFEREVLNVTVTRDTPLGVTAPHILNPKSQSNLPPPTPLLAQSIIGRELAVAEISDLLFNKKSRLLTLSGTGGSGKTRLALEVEYRLRGGNFYKDGITFIALETIYTTELLIQQIAGILGISQQLDAASYLKEIKAFLSKKELLLILDNFEQLLNAAWVLTELLQAAPDLQILVTSRELLKIKYERELWVAPLSPPVLLPNDTFNFEELKNNPAVTLFDQRAVIANRDFKLDQTNVLAVAKICQQLDGLPLAIELAAGRTNLLTPSQILSRLNKRFKILASASPIFSNRHRTLHGALEWSYDLLNQAEKQLFASLAVFAGSFSVEAAESICSDYSFEVLDGLDSLMSKNLLYRARNSEGLIRCQMLQSIREYALEKLTLMEQVELSLTYTRFEEFYLTLVESLESKLRSSEQKTVFDTLEQEYSNIREVIQRALNNNKANIVLRLGGVLWYFWWVRGLISEGRPQLEQALTMPSSELPAQAKALNAAGNLADIQGDTSLALQYFSRSLEIFTLLDDKKGMGNASNNMGNISSVRGEYEAAKTYLQTGLEFRKQVGDQNAIAGSLNNLGRLARIMGDETACLIYYQEALEIVRLVKDAGTMAQVLSNLANLTLNRGELQTARQYAEESYALALETQNRAMLMFSLISLARVAFECEDYSASLKYYQDSLQISEQLDERLQIANNLDGLARVLIETSKYEEAKNHLTKSKAIFETIGARQGLLSGLVSQARLEVRQDTIRMAEATLNLVEQLQAEWQTTLEPLDLQYYLKIKALLH